MSNQLEQFVRDNRQAIDDATPDPALWEELNDYASKPAKFSFRKLLQRIKVWWLGVGE